MPKSFDLSGWMAIVTGSGTGIGRAIALLPAKRTADAVRDASHGGFHVFLVTTSSAKPVKSGLARRTKLWVESDNQGGIMPL